MKQLGAQLRAAGLTPRALAAWAGTDRLSALAPLVGRAPSTPASAALELFVAGREVARDRLRFELDPTLVEGTTTIRARVTILPLGESLLVCDRLDAPMERDLVCWPDDSSYHLARALPQQRFMTWLDIGCGSGFAQLLRPGLATTLLANDINPRALAYTRLGGALSNFDRLVTCESEVRPASLVTCNAPIPGNDVVPSWRSAPANFVTELFASIHMPILVVVHAARAALEPVVAELPGERVIVAYCDDFAVAWWRPWAPARLVTTRRDLTAERPHLTYADYESA